MASEDTPKRPPITYEYAPPRPWPIIIAIATVPPSIGSTMSACCQRPASGAGVSGGGSTDWSPNGISGAGRRSARLIATVPTARRLSVAERAPPITGHHDAPMLDKVLSIVQHRSPLLWTTEVRAV